MKKGYRDDTARRDANFSKIFKVNLSESDIKFSFSTGILDKEKTFILTDTNEKIETEINRLVNYEYDKEKSEYFNILLDNGYYVLEQEDQNSPYEVILFNEYIALSFYCDFQECGLINVDDEWTHEKNFTWIYISDEYYLK